MAQIISCVAAIVFARCTQSYEKRPGLTVMGGILAALIVSVIFIPEKPKKLTPVEAGQEFLRKHVPRNILEDPDLNSINWALGKVFSIYCFGECKGSELPPFLSKETRVKIAEWRSEKLNSKGFVAYLETLRSNFGHDNYDDSGNALFTKIKGMSHFENKASSVFMQAWAANSESDNV